MFGHRLADFYTTDTPFYMDRGFNATVQQYPVSDILNADFNLSTRACQYLDRNVAMTSYYRTPHVMLPWGGDFMFKDFKKYYGSLEQFEIFAMSNSWTGRWAGNVTVKISSAEEYFRRVKEYVE